MSNKKPMILVTIQPIRIIRKHKEELSIFPNENWTEEKIIELIW